MRFFKSSLFGLCLDTFLDLEASLVFSVEPDDLGFIIAQPDDLFTDGARSEVIYGDPSQPGLYVMRITFTP